MNVHSVRRYVNTSSATNGFPETLLGLRARCLVQREMTVAAALDEAAERSPDDDHQDGRIHVLEDLLGGRVRDELLRSSDELRLHRAALLVEVGRMVMKLEELQDARLLARKLAGPRPELVKDRPRR